MIEAPYRFGRSYYFKKLKPVRTKDLRIVSCTEGERGYKVYEIAAREGKVGKCFTTKELPLNSIAEIKYERITPSKKYSSGACLRLATFLRMRKDKAEPDSLIDGVA